MTNELENRDTRQRWSVLLLCLVILLVNDFSLKAKFHNVLTGKLSDFAGLFAFPLFFASWRPRRRTLIYLLTAVGFVCWKSSVSQPLIDAFNTVMPISIGRTVDMTDLLALAVLPLSWRCIDASVPPLRLTVRTLTLSLASVFAFTATSTAPPTRRATYEKDYVFQSRPEVLVRSLIELYPGKVTKDGVSRDGTPYTYSILIKKDFCNGSISNADISIFWTKDGQSRVHLRSFQYYCVSPATGDAEGLLKQFEEAIVQPLRDKEKESR
jgi:hypothetical protein